MSDRLIDAAELADLLGLPSAQVVYQMRHSAPKDLPPAIPLGRRRLRWLKSTVFAWLQERQEKREVNQSA